LNVGRFFTGMCDQGELAFIERSLQELCRGVLYWYPIFPYTVVLTMLNDWVFSSQRKISDSVVELVTHGHGPRGICANVFARGAAAGAAKLSDSCGRVPFVRRCVSELLNAARGRRDRDYVHALAYVVAVTARDIEEKMALWLEVQPEHGDEDIRSWIVGGAALQVFGEAATVNPGVRDMVNTDDDAMRIAMRGVIDQA
jgi:hypothetical protein